MFARIVMWLRAQVLRPRLDREMQEEMAEHLDRATARLVARGIPPNDARRQAMREFGNVPTHQEASRRERGWLWHYSLAGDLRFALRLFGKRRGATLAIVFVLGAGMSVSTALFSFVESYATEPPPGVSRTDDMVRIRGLQVDGSETSSRAFSRDEFNAQSALREHFAEVAAWIDQPAHLGVGADAERRTVQGVATFVSEEYFSTLGVRPVMGPGLVLADFRVDAPTVGVLSDAIWRQQFGARADVIGRIVVVDGMPVTIVGVVARKFTGVSDVNRFKVWLPLSAHVRIAPAATRDAPLLRTVGRLQDGATLEGASQAVSLVALRLSRDERAAITSARSATARQQKPSADVVPLIAASGDPNFERQVKLMTACFTALGLLVLLVTCTNVSALITGLGLARRKEVAVRLAMGAARGRIVRQLLAESVMLAAAAVPLAVGAVWAMQRLVLRFTPDIPFTMSVSVPATLFTFSIALAVGIAFGLSPALHATRVSVAGVLKDSSSNTMLSGMRLQRGFVIAQIALTQPLVVGVATLLLIVAGAYERQGFSPAADQIVSLKVRMAREATPGSSTTRADSLAASARISAEATRLRERIASAPGIERIVPDLQSSTRLDGYGVHMADRVPGGSEVPFRMAAVSAAPGFLETMGIPIIAGSDFIAEDTTGAENASRAVIIGDALARSLFPGVSALGRRLVPLEVDLDAPETPRPMLVVRGVADQIDDDPMVNNDGHRVTVPARGEPNAIAFMIRTQGSALPMMATIRRIVTEELPGAASIETRTLKDLQADMRSALALVTAVLSVGGGIALLVAAIGLYAVVALSVGQRTSEIAVRMAVGARTEQIARRFVNEGLRLGAIGLAIGLPLSLVALRVLLSIPDLLQPVGIGWVGAIAGACVFLVAVVASVIPARRAAGVDPAIVLRAE